MFKSFLIPIESKCFSILLLVMLLLVGCSPNGLLIRYFYGEIDEKLYDRIVAYATFTQAQTSKIKQSVDEFKAWHQVNELPRYAEFLNEIAEQISSERVTEKTILANFKIARNFANASFQQSPFYNSADFLQSLSDQQVVEIENHIAQQDEKFNQWYQQQRSEQGDEERLNRIVKNTKRITDINLNIEQQSIIKKGLEQIQSDSLHRHNIYNLWLAEFVRILNNRHKQNFTNLISKHIANYQNQIKLDNPQQYENNQQIIAKTITQVINSLDEKQKTDLLNRLKKTRKTLIELSQS